MSKPKITTEIIKRYYVEKDDWILGGPFETRKEALDCLHKALEQKWINSERPVSELRG